MGNGRRNVLFVISSVMILASMGYVAWEFIQNQPDALKHAIVLPFLFAGHILLVLIDKLQDAQVHLFIGYSALFMGAAMFLCSSLGDNADLKSKLDTLGQWLLSFGIGVLLPRSKAKDYG